MSAFTFLLFSVANVAAGVALGWVIWHRAPEADHDESAAIRLYLMRTRSREDNLNWLRYVETYVRREGMRDE